MFLFKPNTIQTSAHIDSNWWRAQPGGHRWENIWIRSRISELCSSSFLLTCCTARLSDFFHGTYLRFSTFQANWTPLDEEEGVRKKNHNDDDDDDGVNYSISMLSSVSIGFVRMGLRKGELREGINCRKFYLFYFCRKHKGEWKANGTGEAPERAGGQYSRTAGNSKGCYRTLEIQNMILCTESDWKRGKYRYLE